MPSPPNVPPGTPPPASNYTMALLALVEASNRNTNLEDISTGYGQLVIEGVNQELSDIATKAHQPSPPQYRFRKYIALGGEAVLIKTYCEARQCEVVVKAMLPKPSEEYTFSYLEPSGSNPIAKPQIIYTKLKKKWSFTSLISKQNDTLEAAEKYTVTAAARFNRGATLQEQLAKKVSEDRRLYEFGYIPKVFEIVNTQKTFYTMEYIEDPPLLTWIKQATELQRLLFFKNVLIFFERAIHSNGVVHTDIKPENFHVRKELPIVFDFGMAKNLRRPANLTLQGTQLGSPTYWPPEYKDGVVDRSYWWDIYQLGLLLWVVYCQQVPDFSGILEPTRLDIPTFINRNFPAALLPDDIRYIYEKATYPDQVQRYEDIATFRDQFMIALKHHIPQFNLPTPQIREAKKILPSGWQSKIEPRFVATMEHFLHALGYTWDNTHKQ